jgi:predicted DNA-binding transcriptional regulator AlpA
MRQASKPSEIEELRAIGTGGQVNRVWPLVLTRPEGAKMCGISVKTFDAWVRKGVLPGPIAGTRRWSRGAMERQLAGEIIPPSTTDQPSPFEQWKRDHAH